MKEEFTTNTRRWYDKDPVLSSAMKTLEESDDETQIKVALNLIRLLLNIIYQVLNMNQLKILFPQQKMLWMNRNTDAGMIWMEL